MATLNNVPQINQQELLINYKFAINQAKNILVLGPAGAGKTDIAYQATKESGYEYIYWNMSTMERPDIQGIPAISHDKLTSHFAPNEGLPFQGISLIKDSRNVSAFIEIINNTIKSANINSEQKLVLESLHENLTSKNTTLQTKHIFNLINTVSHLLDTDTVDKIKSQFKQKEDKKIVLLLDEIDKTPQENLQPLLEMLLYHTINGRKLNIQSIIMTGNLPDEFAGSEPLSHALTNRAMVFELRPDAKSWLKWAKNNNVSEIIVTFLSREENAADVFNKRPVSNNELFRYAYPTARSWTAASETLLQLEKYAKENNINVSTEMEHKLIASHIGEEAAVKLKVWGDFYKQYATLIDDIFSGKNGEKPKEADAAIVCAIALAQKVTYALRTAEETKTSSEQLQKIGLHVFNWIEKNMDPDVKICAFRSAFDPDLFKKYNFHNNSEINRIWFEIVELIDELKKDNK